MNIEPDTPPDFHTDENTEPMPDATETPAEVPILDMADGILPFGDRAWLGSHGSSSGFAVAIPVTSSRFWLYKSRSLVLTPPVV